MAARDQNIVSIIKEEIEHFGAFVTMTNVGTVVEVGDGMPSIWKKIMLVP
jgi:F-type H+-transporting ATPase subunit alpha